MKRKITLLWMLIYAGFLFANEEFIFENISIDKGLSNRGVNCIIQDNSGFMWFGTEDGLNKYDGYNFKVFKHDPGDSSSISNSRINCFCKATDHTLWIGTDKGLNKYNPVKDKFIHIKTQNSRKNSLDDSRIRVIFEDRFHFLWIGTQNGLFKYDPSNNTIKQFPFGDLKKNAVSNIIRCIYEDEEGTLWIGTFDGLFNLNPFSGNYTHYVLRKKVNSEIPNNLIISIYNTSSEKGYLWIGTESGLCKFNKKNGDFTLFDTENRKVGLSNSTIKCITQYDKSRLLLGTDWGLDIFDININKATFHIHSTYDNLSIANDVVTAIYKDTAGIIWFATNDGISKLNTRRKKFSIQSLKGIQNEIFVNDITTDKENNIWLGTLDGIIKQNIKTGKTARFLFSSPLKINQVCKRILIDKFDVLWAGTLNGLNYFDKQHQIIKKINIPESPLLLKYIFDITEDENGNIWTNVNNGLCEIIPNRGKDGSVTGFRYYVSIIDREITKNRNNEIRCLQSDKKSNIWFGISNEGLYKYNISTKRFTRYKFDDKTGKSINSNIITDIFIDNNKNVYIITDRGLSVYDEKNDYFDEINLDKQYNFNIQNGIADNNHHLWLSTFLDLIQYDIATGKTVSYNFSHELKNKGFTPTSIYKDLHGRIFIGGYDCYVSFLPKDITSDKNVGPLYITSIKVFDDEIDWDRLVQNKKNEKIELNYNQNFIKIYFSLLDYCSPINNKYSYILEGIDNQWINTSGIQNYATYSNLSPGKYIFKLKGANSDGYWSNDVTTLQIVINPPWWKSWYAYVFYTIIISIILYFIVRTAKSRIILANELKREKIEHEKTEEVNLIKLRFFTNISHEFRTPLSLILGPIENLIEHTDPKYHDQLRVMKSNAERLLRLINQIMDFRKIENKKMELNSTTGEIVSFTRSIFNMFIGHASDRKIYYFFDSSCAECIMPFDKDKIEKVIYNLLSNAFKFTPDNGCVSLSVDRKSKQSSEFVEISVTDTGPGISDEEKDLIFQRFYQSKTKPVEPSQGTGIGLTLCKEFVELHNGEIFFKKEQQAGSTVVVLLPMEDIEETTITKKNENRFDEEKESTNERNRLLIVEDNIEMQQYLIHQLENIYEIDVANNGKTALMNIQKVIPDLIISDLMMPGMDGLELCKEIKSNMATSHIPFILLTAKVNEESAYEGLSFGADDYITKPFSLKLLKVRIAKLIEQRKKLREHFRLNVLSNPKTTIPESNDEKFMYLIVKAIDEDIDNFDLDIESLCKKLNLTHQQVYRKIKALTGQTVSEFIRSVRLKKASQLLRDSDMNISEIMYSVGFSNRSYFSKCFSEQYNLTPKEYKERTTRNKDLY